MKRLIVNGDIDVVISLLGELKQALPRPRSAKKKGSPRESSDKKVERRKSDAKEGQVQHTVDCGLRAAVAVDCGLRAAVRVTSTLLSACKTVTNSSLVVGS